jgi:hypothetical protein
VKEDRLKNPEIDRKLRIGAAEGKMTRTAAPNESKDMDLNKDYLGETWEHSHEEEKLGRDAEAYNTAYSNNKGKNIKTEKTMEVNKEGKNNNKGEEEPETKNKKVFLNTTHNKGKYNTKCSETKTKYHKYLTKIQIRWNHQTKTKTQKSTPHSYHEKIALAEITHTIRQKYKIPHKYNKKCHFLNKTKNLKNKKRKHR